MGTDAPGTRDSLGAYMNTAGARVGEAHDPACRSGVIDALLGLLYGARCWHPVATAPFDRDLEIRIRDEDGVRVAPFPCRQTAQGWVNADLDVRARLMAVEWRPWPVDA